MEQLVVLRDGRRPLESGSGVNQERLKNRKEEVPTLCKNRSCEKTLPRDFEVFPSLGFLH